MEEEFGNYEGQDHREVMSIREIVEESEQRIEFQIFSPESLRERNRHRYQRIVRKHVKAQNIPKYLINFLRFYLQKGDYKIKESNINKLMKIFKRAEKNGTTSHLVEAFGSTKDDSIEFQKFQSESRQIAQDIIAKHLLKYIIQNNHIGKDSKSDEQNHNFLKHICTIFCYMYKLNFGEIVGKLAIPNTHPKKSKDAIEQID